jgi:hypothetical protein
MLRSTQFPADARRPGVWTARNGVFEMILPLCPAFLPLVALPPIAGWRCDTAREPRSRTGSESPMYGRSEGYWTVTRVNAHQPLDRGRLGSVLEHSEIALFSGLMNFAVAASVTPVLQVETRAATRRCRPGKRCESRGRSLFRSESGHGQGRVRQPSGQPKDPPLP